ncbi:(d)CMP kinase [Pacificibacter marinus]|uniref:Cytidylate kinase n=1 Tax=Pacificibacter marinus TaxID=658057 RepID=A0A1Y5SFN4_9RHOB|nr:d(CMP) kinase [Pacificibacter marinus]SLN39330.1 Cytidylate kinase [Pacificibacter marinus]
MSFCVAIDGPAAAGKGTVSRAVAEIFGFGYLDTGLLYRATGAKTFEGLSPIEAAQSLTAEDLQRDDLRSGDAGQAASRVAAIAEVRDALVDFQRAFARRNGGAVLDGRDIGTVICPDAEVKLYITASDEVRAKRRFDELIEAGEKTTLDKVLDDLRERDTRDAARATAPLKPAEDAIIIDTSDMTIDAAVAQVVELIKARTV